MFAQAHLSSLSGSLWMASLPSSVSTTPHHTTQNENLCRELAWKGGRKKVSQKDEKMNMESEKRPLCSWKRSLRCTLAEKTVCKVRIKKLSISKAFDLALYLKHEREILPVLQGMHEVIPVYRLMERRDVDGTEKHFKEYIVHLFKDLIDKQSWSDEGSVSERLLWHLLLLFVCMHRYQPCVDKAKGYLTEWQKSSGNLKCVRLMDQGLCGDVIRSQDLPHSIVFVAKNPAGYHLAWIFLKENWEKVVEKFQLGLSSIAHIVTGVTSRYSTRSQLAEVKESFGSLEEKSTRLRCVRQALETIEDNIRWMDRNFEKVKAWLQNNHL